MSHARLRAPAEHLGILIEPSGPALVDALSAPRRLEAAWLDSTVEHLRDELLSQLKLARPVVATGHQGEFFGAGVFAKTLMTDLLAARCGAAGFFVWVDSDAAKSSWIEYPRVVRGSEGVGGQWSRGRAAIAGMAVGRAMEDQPRAATGEVATMLEAARQGGLLPDDSFTCVVSEAMKVCATGAAIDWVDGLIAAQGAVERELGLIPARPVRLSALCETPAFAAFAARLILGGEGSAAAYNRAIDATRDAGRPAAAARLVVREGAWEVPLWLMRPGEGRRRMFARPRGDIIELLAEEQVIATLERGRLNACASAAAALRGAELGWSIRPRALTLSAFMRLFVADLFIHGLGGAEYDRATEAFARAAWGVELRPMACVTATLQLRPELLADEAAVEAVPASLHELRSNPDRWLRAAPAALLDERRGAVAEVVRLRSEQGGNRTARRAAFQRVREANRSILSAASDEAARLEQRMAMQRGRAAARTVLADRGWYYGFHSRAALAELSRRLVSRLK